MSKSTLVGGHRLRTSRVSSVSRTHASTSPEVNAARAAAVARILETFAGWSTDNLAFILAADDPLFPRPLFALLTSHGWPHKRGLTLLGDAAHVMSLFAGQGTNLAMIDGADLALAIVNAGPDDWDATVASFEAHMHERAAFSAMLSAASSGLLISENGAQKAANMCKKVAARREAPGAGHD